MLDISGNQEERIRKFCDFMGLKNPDEICPIAREIYKFDGQASATLGNIREIVGEAFINRKNAEEFQKFSHISQLHALAFLTAAGAQLTAQMTGKNVSIEKFFMDTHIGTQPEPCFAYVLPDSKAHPNAINVYMPWVIDFCQSLFEAANPTVTQTKSGRLHHYIDRCIESGAEEAYHAYQFNDPEQWAILKPKLQQRYGQDWMPERDRQYKMALQTGKEAVAEFYAADPMEIDAKRFKESIKYRMAEMANKFLSLTRER